MDLSVAKRLIEGGVVATRPNQLWADLGAGDGLFTTALANLLPAKSKIIAIDRDEAALKRISLPRNGVELSTVRADFRALPTELPLFDGIVMANSLHYVSEPIRFLRTLRELHLKASGVLIMVEYDLEKSNPWVPYPVSRNKLIKVSEVAGFNPVMSGESVKSRLNSSEIYSAVLEPHR